MAPGDETMKLIYTKLLREPFTSPSRHRLHFFTTSHVELLSYVRQVTYLIFATLRSDSSGPVG